MKIRKLRTNQGGFTLVELLVVIGILAILLAITLIALNPTQHFQSARNAQRQSDVVAILDAIYEYEAANKGNLPPSLSSVTTTPVALAKGVGLIDTCTDLTPVYIADLPTDPGSGIVSGGTTPCATATTAYNTGYTIAKTSSSNRITIAAPAAEGSAIVSVTR